MLFDNDISEGKTPLRTIDDGKFFVEVIPLGKVELIAIPLGKDLLKVKEGKDELNTNPDGRLSEKLKVGKVTDGETPLGSDEATVKSDGNEPL
jgi:hypothetical protein